jgi:hypothetical protein
VAIVKSAIEAETQGDFLENKLIPHQDSLEDIFLIFDELAHSSDK